MEKSKINDTEILWEKFKFANKPIYKIYDKDFI